MSGIVGQFPSLNFSRIVSRVTPSVHGMLTPGRQDTHHANEVRLLVERAKVAHGKRLAGDWTERSPYIDDSPSPLHNLLGHLVAVIVPYSLLRALIGLIHMSTHHGMHERNWCKVACLLPDCFSSLFRVLPCAIADEVVARDDPGSTHDVLEESFAVLVVDVSDVFFVP